MGRVNRGPTTLAALGAGAGLGLPQLQQNLPVLEVPQLHTQLAAAGAGAGLGLPQFAQNLPVFCAPQDGHIQAAAAACC